MGKFIVLNGEHKGRKFRLEDGATIVIGREFADLSFPDERMSRRHCVLEAREDGDHIKDLGATNGTWLDDEKIKEALLEPGAVIRIGYTEIEFLGLPEHTSALAPICRTHCSESVAASKNPLARSIRVSAAVMASEMLKRGRKLISPVPFACRSRPLIVHLLYI